VRAIMKETFENLVQYEFIRSNDAEHKMNMSLESCK